MDFQRRDCHHLMLLLPLFFLVDPARYSYFAFMPLNFLRSACLVLSVAQALSDVNLFSNQVLGDDQILGDDLGSNFLHPRFDDYSLTDRSLNTDATEDNLFNNYNSNYNNNFLSDNLGASYPIADDPFADNLLADNFLADGGQVCVQAPGRLRARQNSCIGSYDAPNLKSSAEGERVPTAEEVEEYWCAENPRKQGALNLKPVCSVQPGALTFESLLRSFERQCSFFSLIFYSETNELVPAIRIY